MLAGRNEVALYGCFRLMMVPERETEREEREGRDQVWSVYHERESAGLSPEVSTMGFFL